MSFPTAPTGLLMAPGPTSGLALAVAWISMLTVEHTQRYRLVTALTRDRFVVRLPHAASHGRARRTVATLMLRG
ncbi:hypothetical protein [Mycobacterium shigaense]|uniref:Uncharacterized protein n=1 Tax=Mycobacterium shigaense TaxID=722731 RepID=A0A1Z4EFL7_9MYCO|nr:hypothetical protein [Mycobacterium shigaense]MEA1124805.1 hypothetical protein [Mycobacterium shigaense]PRI16479.1 hypothetical protein B2J96_06835 [Mycobacterium shigaense]BAX91754.1 hypothetical protein MSG_01600 [Mycobacterium shigaense]